MNKKIAFFLALLGATFGFGQVDPNRLVATVNGEEIRGEEYYMRMEFMPGLGTIAGEGNQQRFLEVSPGAAILQQLIDERILLQVAKQRGVLPTDAEVKAVYADRAKDIPDFEAKYQSTGLTRAYIEKQLLLELAQFKIVTQGVNIGAQQIENFYKDQGLRYVTPKKYRLGLLVCLPADMAKADADLAAKVPFTDVVKKYSADPVTKARNGDMGDVSEDDLSDEARTAITKVKIGQTTDWVKNDAVNVKFQVVNITPSSKRALDDKLKKEIARELAYNIGINKNDLQKLLKEARKTAKIEIKQTQFKNEMQRIIDQYKVG